MLDTRGEYGCFFVDMSRKFLKHGILLCTSAIGTGYAGQCMLEVNCFV